jgi:hypothetical protein
MLRATFALLALLAATPVAAQSVSSASCNDQSAELVTNDEGTRLTVNGEDVPLDPEFAWENLLCVSQNGSTVFGLTRVASETALSYFLLDPATREFAELTDAEAAQLGFFEDEDDWELGLLDDED